MKHWYAIEGSASPLGVTWIDAEQAFNFALYSRHATAVTLLLYAAGDVATKTAIGGGVRFAGGLVYVWSCLRGWTYASRIGRDNGAGDTGPLS